MPDTRLADISEFQANFDAPVYLAGGYKCIIVRAHNGYRPDHKWPQRRDYVRRHPFIAVGYYQYLAHDRDAAQQAREFIGAVGNLAPNEFPILDLEEGSGNQTVRANAWFKVVDPWFGSLATLYAGLSFGKSNLGGWSHWSPRTRWIAAYQSREPSDPHELWQNTSSAHFPGLTGGVDGNIFHGTAQQFLRTFRHVSTPTPSPGPAHSQAQSQVTVLKHDGRIETFVEKASGEVVHQWQVKENDGWQSSWSSLGNPGR
jgi:GH25 family lysozyme M1 (1,4-beta-N-acetylmuramidase)